MAAGYNAGNMRASDDDRGKVQAVLNEAFAEGRMTKYEWERRANDLADAVTWADLDRLTADLPRTYPGPQYQPRPPYPPVPAVTPPPGWLLPAQERTNSLATAALICGIGQLVVGFPAGVAAIILGRKARREISVTGERGRGMADSGIFLGWAGIGITLLLVLAIALIAVAVTQHS